MTPCLESTVGDPPCSIHPETQESNEPHYTFQRRFWNISSVLQGSSNGTGTHQCNSLRTMTCGLGVPSLGLTVEPRLKTHFLSQLPRLKTNIFSEARCPTESKMSEGVIFAPRSPLTLCDVVQLPSRAVCSESRQFSLAAWASIDSSRLLVVHPPPAESISFLRHTFLCV